jgi:hypothetical protein
MRKLHEAAHEIATGSVLRSEPTELAKPLVEMLEALRS